MLPFYYVFPITIFVKHLILWMQIGLEPFACSSMNQVVIEHLQNFFFLLTKLSCFFFNQVKQNPVQCQSQLFAPYNAPVISRYPNPGSGCWLNIDISMIWPGQSWSHLNVFDTSPDRHQWNVATLSVVVPVIVNIFVKL